MPHDAGAMEIGGEAGLDGAGLDTGGASMIGGAGKVPKKVRTFLDNIDDWDHKELYHKILDFSPAEWEAVRESAHQLMGGAASPMWGEIDGGAAFIGGGMDNDGVSYGDLKDVVLTPSRGAAGRLLELEADAKGAGFKKALKKSVKHASNLFKKGHKGLKTASAFASELEDMGGPVGDYAKKFKDVTNPALETADKIESTAKQIDAARKDASNTDWKQSAKDALKNKDNLKSAVDLTNAALTGNLKETAKEKAREAYNKYQGSGMEIGGSEEIGGAQEVAGRMMDAGAMEIGGAMEVGAGNLEEEKKGGRKRKGGKAKTKIRVIHKKKRAKSPDPLPLEKASASAQEPMMVERRGKKFHDPRRHR